MADQSNKANDKGGAQMRRALLGKLPPLEYHGANVLEALKVDEGSDLRGAIELDVDAFLTPLELTTRKLGGAGR